MSSISLLKYGIFYDPSSMKDKPKSNEVFVLFLLNSLYFFIFFEKGKANRVHALLGKVKFHASLGK